MTSHRLRHALFGLALVMAPTAYAGDTSSTGHGMITAPDGTTEAEAIGVINSVHVGTRTINVTHEPVKALGWPTMTMDLPVTRRVDLSALEAGKNIRFRLKKGRDQRFRVIEIEASK